MCGTAAGGFMCFIVRLIARPFMSLSDTTPAPNVAGTSYLAAVHRTDRTRSRQRCGTSPWLSNLSICRLLFTSACSVEPNNESCKRSSRQLRMAEADVSLPSQCSPVTQTQASQSRANPSGRKKREGMRFRRRWINFDVEATGRGSCHHNDHSLQLPTFHHSRIEK